MARSERLSPVEAIMWRVGHDATLRMTVGTLAVLDRAPDLQALLDRFTAASEQAPRLRWRLDDPSRLRARPAWVDDRPFDPAAHVRRLAVPTPGSLRQVLDLVEMLEHHPFDPERSPWDATLIEGLDGGRVALYLRADHVLTDGMGGMSLIDLLFDEHSWRARLQPEVVAAGRRRRGGHRAAEDIVDDLADADADVCDADAADAPGAPARHAVAHRGSHGRRPARGRRAGRRAWAWPAASIRSTPWCAPCSAASTW